MYILEIVKPVSQDFFAWAYYLFVNYFPLFLNGVKFTLLIALTGTILGLILGLIVGGIRAVKISPKDRLHMKIIKRLSIILTSIYVEVFRGTPMMVQAVFLYYSLKPVLNWSPLVAGIVVVSVNTGAYMAEIIRAGIQSVPQGQSEAALSIGMTNTQTMFNIVLPQALKNAFPAIGNEFVVNIKDSSVLNVISVTEVFFQTNSVAGTFYKTQEAFFVAACIYLFLTFTTTRVLAVIEKKLDSPSKGYTGSQTVPQGIHLEGAK